MWLDGLAAGVRAILLVTYRDYEKCPTSVNGGRIRGQWSGFFELCAKSIFAQLDRHRLKLYFDLEMVGWEL
jgi:hypothetical protein